MFGLEAKVIWLLVFVALYWSYCIYWGVSGARQSKTAGDYFIAGRSISIWVFVLAATATSFSAEGSTTPVQGLVNWNTETTWRVC